MAYICLRSCYAVIIFQQVFVVVLFTYICIQFLNHDLIFFQPWNSFQKVSISSCIYVVLFTMLMPFVLKNVLLKIRKFLCSGIVAKAIMLSSYYMLVHE